MEEDMILLKVHQSVVEVLNLNYKSEVERHQSVVKELEEALKHKPGLLQQKYVARVKELEDRIKVCTVITEKAIAQRDRYKKALEEIAMHDKSDTDYEYLISIATQALGK